MTNGNPAANSSAIDIAMRVLAAGIIDPPGLTKARDAARIDGVGLICAMVRHSLVDTTALAAFLAQTLRMRVIDLDVPEASRLGASAPAVPEAVCRRYRVMPIGTGLLTGGRGDETILHLAMSDPTDADAIAAVSRVVKLGVQPCLVEDGALERALIRLFHAPDEADDDSSAPTMPSFSLREPTSPDTLEPLNARSLKSLEPVNKSGSGKSEKSGKSGKSGKSARGKSENSGKGSAPKPADLLSAEPTEDDRRRHPRSVSFHGPTEVLSMDELGIKSAQEDETQGGSVRAGTSASSASVEASGFEGPKQNTTVDFTMRPGTKRRYLDDISDVFSEETRISSESQLSAAQELLAHKGGDQEPTDPTNEIAKLRLCIVVGDAELRARLRLELNKEIDHVSAVRTLTEAVHLVPTEHFDLVMVYGPRNDVRTGQLLNELGRTHSISTVVFSDDAEFDGLTGVMARLPPPSDATKAAAMLLRVVRVAARSILR